MNKPEDGLARVGELVVYHNEVGLEHNALVTSVWGKSCINVVMVSSDSSKKDGYGRQLERRASCMHGSVGLVHGNYWRFEDEEPNKYAPPVER